MYNKRSVLEFQDFTNDEEFQNLLRELVIHEPNIREADIYGTRGFKQYGIDVLAIESNGVGFAIQAKCYKKFTISDLNKTYSEFKKHLAYWQSQNLRTFVIAISCKVEDPKILERVSELRKDLFSAAQMSLIFWQAATIADKLKYHRKIAEKYIDNTTIVDLLCGKDPIEQAAFLAYKEKDRLQLFSTQTQQWRDETSRHEYEHVLHLIRIGQRPSALQTLKTITEAQDWTTRSTASQAAFLRLTAQLHLAVEKDDVAARAAAETANRLDPEHPDEQVAIQILVSQGQKDQALAQALTFTTDSGRLQAAALLLASDPQRSLDLLSQIHAPDQAGQVVRLRAIALALTGQVAEALTVIERQAQQAPDHYQLHLTRAQLLYFSVLSPAFRTIDRLQTVLPISQGLLQLNEQGIERLQEAQDISARLLTLPDIDPELRNDTALLHLATLTQHPQPGRQFQATTFLQNEIKAGRLTPEEALWAIQYHWPLDLHLHLSALEQSANPNGPLAVMAWHEQQGHLAEALALLERHEARLRQADPTIVEHWLHRLQPAPPASAVALLTRALAGREQAVTQLDAFLAGEGDLGDALQVLQRSNQPALLDRAPALITRVATPAVVALCVETAVNQKQYLLAEHLWIEHTELMDGAVLPGHLRRALSRMWFELGKLPEALQDARLLAEAEPTAYHQMHLIDLMVNAALTVDLRPKLTRLLECADLTVTQGLRALRYAQAIQETRLAQRLLLVAADHIKNDLEVEYVVQAQLMGNFPAMPAVASRFQTLLAEGKTQLFTLIKVEDFLAQTQLQNDGYKVYEQGDVSLHHLHSQEPVEFACAYLEAGPHLPLYIRHGGLTVSVREDGPPELQGVTTLAMDLTSLLLAARLKVLDLLAQEFEIAVATDHVRDLTYMLADLPSTSDSRAVIQDLLSWIREQHEQNRLTYKPSPEDRRHDHSAEILGLAALVVPAATASERLCLDDRWAQQMALQNRRLLTDLVSVLNALVQRGQFSETAYFQAVHQLRRAGMRFLPITARELLHWLRAAEVQGGRVRETDDLALLRQYYAGCFGAASPLQPITVQGTNDLDIGEMPFLLRYLHETKQALKDVFKSERSPVALANWMFEHLLIDMVAVGELPWGRHPHGRSVNHLRELELLDLASFDVTMTPQSKEAYYKWVNRTLIQPRLTLDPELSAPDTSGN